MGENITKCVVPSNHLASIIHVCAAPTSEGSVRKVNETEMFQNIFKVGWLLIYTFQRYS